MTKEIKVIDYVMGTGKTKYIFEYMQANPHKKYIYVTPLLSEAEKRAVEQGWLEVTKNARGRNYYGIKER